VAWKPDYAVLNDLKGFMRIPLEDTQDDAELARAITASSRAVDKHCYRQFGLVAAEARRYTARWHTLLGRWVIDIDDLMSTAGVVVTVEAGTITEYDLIPLNAAQEGRPWERLEVLPTSAVQPTCKRGGVDMTAPWGWTAFPVEVVEGTLLQSSRFEARRNSPFGVAGSPETGSELRLLSRLDPDVGVSLSDLIRRVAR
jgi:hypothetical protein